MQQPRLPAATILPDTLARLLADNASAQSLDDRRNQDRHAGGADSGSGESQVAGNVLLVDVRPPTDFSRAHIVGAVNLNVPSTLLKREGYNHTKMADLVGGDTGKALRKLETFSNIIVYDTDSENALPNTSLLSTLVKLEKSATGGCIVAFLNGGFEGFRAKFPQHISDGSQRSHSLPSSLPTGLSLHLPAVPPTPPVPQHQLSESPPDTSHTSHTFLRSTSANAILTAPPGLVNRGPPRFLYGTDIETDPPPSFRILRQRPGASLSPDLAKASLPSFLVRVATAPQPREELRRKYNALQKEETARMGLAAKAGGPYDPFSVSVGIESGYKNRYTNIWPYAPAGSDYINASHVRTSKLFSPAIQGTGAMGPSGPALEEFVCTQGPIAETVGDFWQMVRYKS
ncbi:hypothetical protein HDU93_007687 [Gonapodya sp. JEL0774]|nr:hypothetical protein HDU93_007687 [Gonapodya sp. JEL0774]